jgi:putrescine aminotransferase
MPTRDATFSALAEYLSPGKAAAYEGYGLDVVMGERGGAKFHDAYDDREWFNCHCNGGVFNLGHRNPDVVEAVQGALGSADIGNHHLASAYRSRLARRLAATTGDALKGVVFGVSGGEAIDLAIKAVRGATGRAEVISAHGGYHGHTGLALAAGDAQYREPFGPNLPHFEQVPFGDLEALRAAASEKTAAIILEPIPATLGMVMPPPGYLEGVRKLCDQTGAKFIADEVQTGLGRTGKMWCVEHDGVEPDVLVAGKGLSGGVYPITATLMKPDVHRVFVDHPFAHISTFGGAELGCVAALAVLDVIETPGFLDHVNELSERFARGLSGLPFELRRQGLMMGLKFPAEGGGMLAAKLLYDAGVFTVYANNDTSVLQFLPPLNITVAEADEIIAAVRKVFGG